MKETQSMGLNQLSHVYEFAHEFGGFGNLHSENRIAGFGRCQQMADRTNSANPGGDTGHFGEMAPFTEFLESAKFNHVKPGIIDLLIFIQMDGDFGMPFDPGYRVYGYSFAHNKSF